MQAIICGIYSFVRVREPVGGHVSNVMWLVEGTTVMLRVPLAA